MSLALCEQILAVDKSHLKRHLGYVDEPPDRTALDHAMAVQLGLVA